MTELRVANAPVSYGAFELTVGTNPNVPDPDRLLDLVRDAGYTGVDLGPVGYLGTGAELADRLAARGLLLAGGYLQVPFSDPAALEGRLGALDSLLDVMDAVGGEPRPLPTLADEGSDLRRRYPGRAATDRSLGLSAAGWVELAAGVRRVSELCRSRGYEPTLHPHAGTYVEAGWEVERLLAETDIGICLDPGHLAVGGVNSIDALKLWAPRINHVHLKDADATVLERLVDEGAAVDKIYSSGAFRRLGDGTLDFGTLVSELLESGYSGWVVVEQDVVPASPAAVDTAAEDQRANRAFLHAHGL